MNLNWLEITFIILFSIVIGVAGTFVYKEISQDRIYNGLWIPEATNYTNALEIAKGYEGNGNWICINIKGMDYKQMIQTCNHEVAHEIFASKCTNNIEECLN